MVISIYDRQFNLRSSIQSTIVNSIYDRQFVDLRSPIVNPSIVTRQSAVGN